MLGIRVIRSVIRNLWLVLLFPVIMAGTVFYLTRNEKKIYDCKMTIYTGISAAKVGVGDGTKLDFFTANNAMDNLIAILKGRNTIQAATTRLLAMHLAQPKHQPDLMSWESFQALKTSVSDSLRKFIVVEGNVNATEARIKEFLLAHPEGPLARLFQAHRHYGIDPVLEKVTARRRASSDMIDISFESDDAAICMHTLKLLSEAYFTRYRDMKRAQNASAVEYFENQLRDAFLKLRDSEERLKVFITENKILNYYEQGKSLSIYEKEEEQEEQDVRQRSVGADQALKGLEEKLGAGKERSRTIDSLALLRSRVTEARARLNAMMLDRSRYGDAIVEARDEIKNLYEAISRQVSLLYNQDFSVEGISSSQILSEWLALFTEREKQLAYLELVSRSKNMISDRISDFAPLGAELKRLEREVSVNESQYLSILHGLNMANLQRQSVEQASVQELIDEPFVPRAARKSKRMMLVIAAGFAGLVLVLGGLIARVVFDSSLQNSSTAEEKTGLRVLGSFPAIRSGKADDRFRATEELAGLQLFNQIESFISGAQVSDQTIQICILQSLAIDQGPKIARHIQQSFKTMGRELDSYFPSDQCQGSDHPLPPSPEQLVSLTWSEFLLTAQQARKSAILLCLPPLKNIPLPVQIIKESHLLILSANASRQWKDFDRQVAGLAEGLTGRKPFLVLDQVDSDHLKDYFGHIPIRSWIGRSRKKYR